MLPLTLALSLRERELPLLWERVGVRAKISIKKAQQSAPF